MFLKHIAMVGEDNVQDKHKTHQRYLEAAFWLLFDQ